MTTVEEPGVVPAKRVTRRRVETRRRLIEAAYEVFTEMGIRDAPVEVICERAGYTRGAFYSNFGSKEGLFLAVYQEQMRSRLERLQQVVDTTLAAVDLETPGALQQALGHIGPIFRDWLTVDETWFLLNIEFRAQALRQPELRGPTEAAYTRFYDDLGQVLEDILSRFGARLAVTPRDAVLVIVSMYETALERALLGGLPVSTDSHSITEIAPRLLLAMVASREAQETYPPEDAPPPGTGH